MRQLILVAVVSVILAGCARQLQRYNSLDGPNLKIEHTAIQEYQAYQEETLKSLRALAGLPSLPANGIDDWRPIVDAGINYVDQECEKYIDAIFWFNRYRKTVVSQVTLMGTATAGALGILEAAAKEIALTAVGFGITVASIDNIANSVLYQIEPSGVRSIVERSQAAYLTGMSDVRYTTRSAAMRAIQSYLALCLPATLESEVNKAVGTAQFEAPKPPEGPPANFVPSVVQVSRSLPEPIKFKRDDAAQSLEDILFVDPEKKKLDRVKAQEMKTKCWPKAGVEDSTLLPDFMNEDRFATQRRSVLTCMRGL